jgi:hypothetical protein
MLIKDLTLAWWYFARGGKYGGPERQDRNWVSTFHWCFLATSAF